MQSVISTLKAQIQTHTRYRDLAVKMANEHNSAIDNLQNLSKTLTVSEKMSPDQHAEVKSEITLDRFISDEVEIEERCEKVYTKY
jgi:hypothetical protein